MISICRSRVCPLTCCLPVLLLPAFCQAQWTPEALSRGVVAVPAAEGQHLVSWRLLVTDPQSIVFHVDRIVDGQPPEQVSDDPVRNATCLLVPHNGRPDVRYQVRAIVDDTEHGRSTAVSVWEAGFVEVPIQSIDGYRPGDASVADLDGDGEYEIVLQQSGRTHDNSHSGLTDPPVLDAYELDGTRLWRINLGLNTRDGEHYTQFMVYDLDGDGRAEMACKTADGTVDGVGNTIGDATADWRTTDEDSPAFGRILDGPEYLTVFEGTTGAALHSVEYVPGREPIDGWGGIGGNGGNDRYGNRCDRFLACVACLDGRRPSLVMCRGVYGRTVLVAWNWRDGQLFRRWVFDSGISRPPYDDASPYSGMGGHSLAVADVDADGRDEIVYQAMVVDDDGQGLYTTGLRHGDAMHVGDLDPARSGQEVFTVQESEQSTVRLQTPGAAMRDARTGEILWSHSPGVDVPSGLVADIDPRYWGCEAWGGPGGLRTAGGESIGAAPRSTRFAIWWDGDLLRELLDGSRVTKWDWEREQETTLIEFGSRRRRGFRNPCLMGDLIGDWREEILLPAPDGRSLRLYTTPLPTSHRVTTLMHDRQYRLGIAWQNVAYNKPPHPSFYLGEGKPGSDDP